jgi:septal ring factor EnvC (AmiA/AmiB activator)
MSQLTRERERLEREVQLTQQLLEQSRGLREKSYNELNLLNEQIALQERIVGMMEREVSDIDSEISGMGSLIESMDRDMAQLRRSYTQVARQTYVRRDNMSVLMWVLSADNFRQAFQRLMYFRLLGEHRKDQIRLIKRTQQFLMSRRADFQHKREQKQRLVAMQQEQRRRLDRAKEQQAEVYRQVKRQERSYQARLREHQRNLENLKEQIRVLIESESRRTLTTAERDRLFNLSQSFSQNKRRLPWPIPMPNAVITGHFGVHSDESGGMVNNEGIYLSTRQGQSIRAIFEGTVTMISEIPSFGKVVIVQHGNFRSVYANLQEVFVRKGQRVETLQNLGVVRTNGRTGETQLYFQIYKEFTPVDPMAWLAPKN